MSTIVYGENYSISIIKAMLIHFVCLQKTKENTYISPLPNSLFEIGRKDTTRLIENPIIKAINTDSKKNKL